MDRDSGPFHWGLARVSHGLPPQESVLVEQVGLAEKCKSSASPPAPRRPRLSLLSKPWGAGGTHTQSESHERRWLLVV